MPRSAPLLALLLLPGCLANMLWPQRDDALVLSQRRHATFAVVAAAMTPAANAAAEPDAPAPLLLQLRRARGAWVDLVDGRIGARTTLAFAFAEPALAPAIADLLVDEPLGPIDRCELEVEWTRSPDGYEFWEGRISLGGDLDGFLERSVVAADEAAALVPRAVPPPPTAQAGLAAAATLDWRVLLPWLDDGHGTVLACLPPRAEPEDVDLLVQIGANPPHRFVRVPAALVPVLAAVRRDPDTLLPRFVLRAHARVAPKDITAAWRPLAHPRVLQFVTRVEEWSPRGTAFERYFLRPILQAIDVVGTWVLSTLLPELLRSLPRVLPRCPNRR